MLPGNIQHQCKQFDKDFMQFVLLQIKDSNICAEAVISVLSYHVCHAFINAEIDFDKFISTFKNQWDCILKNKDQGSQDMETKKEKKKVSKVMREFDHGKLHSSSKNGPKVTNPKQALAIGLSEAGIKKKRK